MEYSTVITQAHLCKNRNILEFPCRPAPDCCLFISLAILAKLFDRDWEQWNSSIMLRAHLCPYSTQESQCSTIIAFLQWYHHHAIPFCKNMFQEIDLILIWQNYQGRKLDWQDFSCTNCVFKGKMSIFLNNKPLLMIDCSKYALPSGEQIKHSIQVDRIFDRACSTWVAAAHHSDTNQESPENLGHYRNSPLTYSPKMAALDEFVTLGHNDNALSGKMK